MKSLNPQMTRRQAIAAGLGMFATFGLAACGGSGSSTTTASSEAAASDTINPDELTEFIVGFDQNFPPYGYVGDDGEFTGFDLELAQECAKRNGWTCTLDPIDWDAKDALIGAGEITCIWNGFSTEAREDKYTFAGPYMRGGQVAVVRADSGITSLDDLAGKNVQVQVDSSGLRILESDYPDLIATFGMFEQIADANTMFMNLESGATDAIVCGNVPFVRQDTANPGVYSKLSDMLNDEHVAVGFKLGETALAERVQETLKAMDEDGFVEELCAKYNDQGISYEYWCLE